MTEDLCTRKLERLSLIRVVHNAKLYIRYKISHCDSTTLLTIALTLLANVVDGIIAELGISIFELEELFLPSVCNSRFLRGLGVWVSENVKLRQRILKGSDHHI